MGRGNLGDVRVGRETHPEVRDGRRTIIEVWEESGDPRGGPGRVGGLSRRCGTDRWTLGEVRDGSEEPR